MAEIRKVGPGGPLVPGQGAAPVRAPRPLEPVKPRPRRRARAAPGEGNWLEELLFEQTFGAPEDEDPDPGAGDPGCGGGGGNPSRFSMHELQGHPAQPPNLNDPGTRQAVFSRLFRPRMDELVARIHREPVYRQAFGLWSPHAPDTHRNVGREIARYLAMHTSQVFGFNLAPITFVDRSAAFGGKFNPTANKVELELRSLRGPLRAFVAVNVHEQMHRYQAELIARQHVVMHGTPLSADERGFAAYMSQEMQRYPTLSDDAIRQNPELRKRYEENGLELHANYVADYVADRALRA